MAGNPNRTKIESQAQLQIALVLFASDLAESRALRIQVKTATVPDSSEIRMVDKVKRLGTEFKSALFRDQEPLEQSKIPVLEPWTIDHVAYKLLVERAGSRRNENRTSVRISRRDPLRRIAGAFRKLVLDSGVPIHDPELPHAGAVIPAPQRCRAHARKVVVASN